MPRASIRLQARNLQTWQEPLSNFRAIARTPISGFPTSKFQSAILRASRRPLHIPFEVIIEGPCGQADLKLSARISPARRECGEPIDKTTRADVQHWHTTRFGPAANCICCESIHCAWLSTSESSGRLRTARAARRESASSRRRARSAISRPDYSENATKRPQGFLPNGEGSGRLLAGLRIFTFVCCQPFLRVEVGVVLG